MTDIREAFDLKRPGETHIIEHHLAVSIANALYQVFHVPTRAERGHVYAETQDERNQDVFRAFAKGWVEGKFGDTRGLLSHETTRRTL